MAIIRTSIPRPVALVTGASRGIGRGIALALAGAGYDLVITGRTAVEGTATNPATGNTLPGSLSTTASEAENLGARCMAVIADSLDIDNLHDSFNHCLDAAHGGIDVLINNAIYVGPGNATLFADSNPSDIVKRVTGNLTAPLLLTHFFVQHLLASPLVPPNHHRGTIINITSDAGQRIPEHTAGNGGWSLVYAATKAGFHRMADMLSLEYGSRGIHAVNVDPGLVATERVLDSGAELQWIIEHGVRPEIIGQAIVLVLKDPLIANGAYIHAQDYLRSHLGNDEYEILIKMNRAEQ